MKYLKISCGSNGSNITYPYRYEEEIGKFSIKHLYYDDGLFLKLLLCIPDKDYTSTMIRAGSEEITEAQAIAISESKQTRKETIKDEAKLRRIELKVAMGATLTKEESEATDITKPTSVFGVTSILADEIVKIKVAELQ